MTLKDILEVDISCCPKLLLLNEVSSFSFSVSQKKNYSLD